MNEGTAHDSQSRGWFKAMRSEDALELIRRNPNAFVLAYMIASRARWRVGFDAHELQPGEAFLGDHESYGMSEQQYRTAKAQLAKWAFAKFKPTNKGTIARLTDTRLFDVLNLTGNGQNNGPPTDKQRTPNDPATINEEGKQVKPARAINDEPQPPAPVNGNRSSVHRSVEERLMQELRELLGEDEMARAGGNWRVNWVRKKPDLVRSGIDEMRLRLREGFLIENRAAWLVDLLQRWSAPLAMKCPSPQVVKPPAAKPPTPPAKSASNSPPNGGITPERRAEFVEQLKSAVEQGASGADTNKPHTEP